MYLSCHILAQSYFNMPLLQLIATKNLIVSVSTRALPLATSGPPPVAHQSKGQAANFSFLHRLREGSCCPVADLKI
jgi:hypothetical protein